MGTAPLLTGTELVLIAQVPKAGGRWGQAHFNVAVTERFFRLSEGEGKVVTLEKIDQSGKVVEEFQNPLVYSKVNKNYKIEFDFKPAVDYPEEGRPILVILELGLRRFRYLAVMPGEPGHQEMLHVTEAMESVGGGLPRVITTLDEVELRWPGCPLRGS